MKPIIREEEGFIRNNNYLVLICFPHPFLFQRRETWCPGAALSKAPLASAASLAVQSRLQRIGSSPSSDGSEFDEMPRETFFSRLDEEEERKSNEFGQRRVGFVSPKMKRLVLGIIATEGLPSPFLSFGGPLRKLKIAGISEMIDGSENANVIWLLNLRVRVFLTSAVEH